MERIDKKIKDIVEVRSLPTVTDLAHDARATLECYRFTDITADLAGKWLDQILSLRPDAGKAIALAGFRGVGKSHLLSVISSILSEPDLRDAVTDLHVKAAADRLSAAHPVAMVRRGLRTSLVEELKDAILTICPGEALGSSVDELITQAGEAGSDEAPTILIVDTAAGRDGPVTRDDGPLLAEIGEAAKRNGIFVGLALDDDIAGADGANRAISSVYAIDYLDQEHLYRIVDAHLFAKKEQTLSVLRKIYQGYHDELPGFRWSEPKFRSLYPLHPAILEIAPLIRLFVQDFSALRFAADSGASSVGRPATSLIGLDEAFDAAEPRLRESRRLHDALQAFDEIQSTVVANCSVNDRMASKLATKGLFLLSLDGRGATPQELSAAMLIPGSGSTGIDMAALLEAFAAAEPSRIRVSEGRYRFNIAPGFGITIRDVGQLIAKFFSDGQETADIQELARAFALPLGLAKEEDGTIAPATAEELLQLPMVEALCANAAFDNGGKRISLSQVDSVLGAAPFELTSEAQHLVLGALVAQRELEFVTTSGDRINHRSLDLQILWDEIDGVTKAFEEEYSAERLLEWARLVTGNSRIASLEKSEDRLVVIDTLTGWLENWRAANFAEQFASLPDDHLTASIWRTAERARKTFGIMAGVIDQLTQNMTSLDQCLHQIADLFWDSETEFERQKEELVLLRHHIDASRKRRWIADYVAMSEPTLDPAIEQARSLLLDLLRSGGTVTDPRKNRELEEAWTGFHRPYAEHYAARHAEVLAASATALDDVMKGSHWTAFESLSRLSKFDKGYAAAASAVIRRSRARSCTADVSAVLAEQACCTCSLSLDRYDPRKNNGRRLAVIVGQGLAHFSAVLNEHAKALKKYGVPEGTFDADRLADLNASELVAIENALTGIEAADATHDKPSIDELKAQLPDDLEDWELDDLPAFVGQK